MNLTREQRNHHRIFFVMDKIAKEIDQLPDGNTIKYWTQDPTEYQLYGLEKDERIPNPREEVDLLELLSSEGILFIKSNHSEYE